MTKTTNFLIIIMAILFIAAIVILLKQFFDIRSKDKAFDSLAQREGDCVAFSYSAKAKSFLSVRSDVYAAKKSGVTPLTEQTVKKTFEYNAVSTY